MVSQAEENPLMLSIQLLLWRILFLQELNRGSRLDPKADAITPISKLADVWQVVLCQERHILYVKVKSDLFHLRLNESKIQ